MRVGNGARRALAAERRWRLAVGGASAAGASETHGCARQKIEPR